MKKLTKEEEILLLHFFVSAYSFVLNKGYYRLYTGAEFAEAIRRTCSQDDAKNRIAAEMAERHIANISVRADGYTKWEVAE